MRLVFFDATSSRAYSSQDVGQRALGGTEAMVIRVAESLDGVVLQACRTSNEGRYRRFDDDVRPTHVVSLRSAETVLEALRRFPDARHTLWLHDLCTRGTNEGKALQKHGERLADRHVSLVCVSRFHAKQVRDLLGNTHGLVTDFIYNAVEIPELKPQPKNPGKLVYFSSPHKGLPHALRVFHYARLHEAGFELHIANPGYNNTPLVHMPGVKSLGSIPRPDILSHVANALCTFYPNFTYPETFGLVMAESHGVGTPVLTHPIGAAPEIVADPAQLLPIPWRDVWIERLARQLSARGGRAFPSATLARLNLFATYRRRLLEWRDGRAPDVALTPTYTLAAVSARWKEHLSS